MGFAGHTEIAGALLHLFVYGNHCNYRQRLSNSPPSSNSIQETTFRWDNIQVRLLLSILLRPNSTAALSVQFLDPSAPFFALTFGLYPTISYQLLMFSRLFEIQLPWNTYFVFIYSGVVNSYTRAVMKRDGREKKLSCSHKTRKYKLFLGNCQSPFI